MIALGAVVLVAIVLAAVVSFWTWVVMVLAGIMGLTLHGHNMGFTTLLPVGVFLTLITGIISRD